MLLELLVYKVFLGIIGNIVGGFNIGIDLAKSYQVCFIKILYSYFTAWNLVVSLII
jgi:hypothetical protein